MLIFYVYSCVKRMDKEKASQPGGTGKRAVMYPICAARVDFLESYGKYYFRFAFLFIANNFM